MSLWMINNTKSNNVTHNYLNSHSDNIIMYNCNHVESTHYVNNFIIMLFIVFKLQ
jgi:hypothetical protein